MGQMLDDDATRKFSDAMARLGLEAPRLAVAVSGGGDSMALALLAQAWAEAKGGHVLALTVDHGLRDGSRAEAEGVHAALAQRGIRHEILAWEGGKPATHIQERAREARYRLLLDACRRENIPVLAVAHNLEDQIETFWMRLAHGSGLDGLAAMAPARDADGVRVIRPLMGFSRGELRDACRARGAEWVEDPSNENGKFLRVRLRQFEDVLAGEGLTPQRLGLVLQKLDDARAALQEVAQRELAACAVWHDAGYATLNLPGWRRQPGDIRRRMLARLLQDVAPQEYPPGFEALEQLRRDMAGAAFAGQTLAGCEVFPDGADHVSFCREAVAARRAPLANGVWDGRFQVAGYRGESRLDIGILGEDGIAALRREQGPEKPAPEGFEALPFKVKRALPALWQGENLVAVPHLKWFSPQSPPELGALTLAWLGKAAGGAVSR